VLNDNLIVGSDGEWVWLTWPDCLTHLS